MTLSLYIQCGLMFFLGEALYLFWIKFPAFKERAMANNKPFKYSEWWECDKNLIIGLNILAPTLFVGADQIIHFQPEVMDYMKWLFWLVGFSGCNVVLNKLSQFSKGQITMLSLKANVADILTGGTTTVVDTIEKGKEVTGKDITQSPTAK